MPHYVKNSELLQELIKSKEQDKLTERCIEMTILIAHESSKKLKYKDPMDREDCISGAIMDVLLYWRSFNPQKSTNAFSYITQMCKNGMGKAWKKLHHPDAGQQISLSSENIFGITPNG